MTDYQKYFKKMLDKFGAKTPEDLDDAKKREFYDEIDKGWESEKEKRQAALASLKIGDTVTFK